MSEVIQHHPNNGRGYNIQLRPHLSRLRFPPPGTKVSTVIGMTWDRTHRRAAAPGPCAINYNSRAPPLEAEPNPPWALLNSPRRIRCPRPRSDYYLLASVGVRLDDDGLRQVHPRLDINRRCK